MKTILLAVLGAAFSCSLYAQTTVNGGGTTLTPTGGSLHTSILTTDTPNPNNGTSTSEALIASYAIPVTSASPGVIRFSAFVTATAGNTGTCNLIIRLNTSAAVGGTQIVNRTAAASTVGVVTGQVKIRGSAAEAFLAQGNSGSASIAGGGASAYTVASGVYLLFDIQNSVAADTCTFNTADVWYDAQ